MTGDLSKIYVKIGATKASINFLTRCRKYHVIPKGFKSLQRISMKKSVQMEDRFARIRMREELNALHAKLFMLELDTKLIPVKNKPKYKLEGLKQTQDREYFSRMKNLNKKFTLLVNQRKKKVIAQYKLDAVLNLCSIDLSADETRVLAPGL